MDASDWLGLRSTHNPMRWVLPVTQGICTDKGFLFGGCALGAAIAAMEGTTERPVIWATAQYLSYAHTPSMLDIDVTVAVEGHAITQARAVGHVGDTEILTVNAALGCRDLDLEEVWVTPPADAPAPDTCPPVRLRPPEAVTGSIRDRIDLRLVQARPWNELAGNPMPEGRSVVWARMPEGLDLSSGGALAVLGDYVPFGIHQATGRTGMNNSLDNTLRVYRLTPTEWVLLDIAIHGLANGVGHGLVHLWAEDGTLLATASQSSIVRLQ
jgi:acyl-CoA thioesterase II